MERVTLFPWEVVGPLLYRLSKMIVFHHLAMVYASMIGRKGVSCCGDHFLVVGDSNFPAPLDDEMHFTYVKRVP